MKSRKQPIDLVNQIVREGYVFEVACTKTKDGRQVWNMGLRRFEEGEFFDYVSWAKSYSAALSKLKTDICRKRTNSGDTP